MPPRAPILDGCLAVLRHEAVQAELKGLAAPVAELIVAEIYPYVVLALAFVTTLVVLHMSVFLMLYRLPRQQRAGDS